MSVRQTCNFSGPLFNVFLAVTPTISFTTSWFSRFDLRTVFYLQLEKSENESHWKLLNIFAFGTYSDYKGKIDSVAEKKKPENITPLYYSQKTKT